MPLVVEFALHLCQIMGDYPGLMTMAGSGVGTACYPEAPGKVLGLREDQREIGTLTQKKAE